ncbi:protein LURP-one-related 11-like [Salvia miltiorrhiza]|uniref:protein LURP-one-related 11-like n=1 Tax=Salvia miltiorrhiza TaxID=226208 RepID=UPI0025ABE057|nr:protein LURP-one-related 11-like [Salvia miltiorrhiza]
MAKVHPQLVASCTSSKQEVFTLWMKSLIMSSNGCAVFDSNGRIVFRVDNYSHRCTTQICIMDVTGQVLFTIVKKKFSLFATWEGYRSTTSSKSSKVFKVRKLMGITRILGCFRGYSICKALIKLDEDFLCEYKMENQSSKQSCRIVDAFGGLVAEVKRKITTSGVVLGEDVLTMVVEPHIDHSLIMGLVVVFGLMHHKL